MIAVEGSGAERGIDGTVQCRATGLLEVCSEVCFGKVQAGQAHFAFKAEAFKGIHRVLQGLGSAGITGTVEQVAVLPSEVGEQARAVTDHGAGSAEVGSGNLEVIAHQGDFGKVEFSNKFSRHNAH